MTPFAASEVVSGQESLLTLVAMTVLLHYHSPTFALPLHTQLCVDLGEMAEQEVIGERVWAGIQKAKAKVSQVRKQQPVRGFFRRLFRR